MHIESICTIVILIKQDKVHFLIKWEGWPSVFNSWEPEEHLIGSQDIIKEFVMKYPSPNFILPVGLKLIHK